ncbi:MAG: metal-dependent hydrolase [Nannocystaceae bacterium]
MPAITVRRMSFAYPDELDPVILPGEPEESYTILGLSLLLPYLEPYLIRTMNAARKRIQDPALRDDIKRFSAQEGQHYREHARFNDAIRRQGFPALAALEEELARDYERFSARRSLRFNLAYAEGFEAMTTATARFFLLDRKTRPMPARVDALMCWHAIEELEHRTVAFDVYERLYGGYLYRLGAGLFAQWHLLRFVIRVARAMLDADPRWPSGYDGEAGRKRRRRGLTRRLVFGLLPKLLPTYAPWYTPRKIAFDEEMQALARRFSREAKSTS